VMSRISRGRRLLAGAVTANQRAWLRGTAKSEGQREARGGLSS
jgi:hypothetical protein